MTAALERSIEPNSHNLQREILRNHSLSEGKDIGVVVLTREPGQLLNPATREVWRQNELVEITSIEFDILEVLARSAGRTVTRDELTAVLYQRRATPYERSLDVHISHLRKKLERENRSLIRTIRGVGYQFAP